MRHRHRGRKLGRTSAHRKALFRNQLAALFTHERITTTLAKAKDLRPLAERLITLSRTGTLPARRRVLTMVPDREVVRLLFEVIAPRFMERPGGYTRIMRLGRRHGDGAEMAIIELVDYELSEKESGSGGEKRTSFMDRAKSMFGGGKTTGDAEETVEAAGPDEPVTDEPVTDEPEADADAAAAADDAEADGEEKSS